MKKDKILAFVGPSGSGKTTIAKILDLMGYNMICSYTTRQSRYYGEEGHIFVDKNGYQIIKNNNGKVIEICDHCEPIDFIAYTYYHNNHYWATREQYKGKGISIYVVDPTGVNYLLDKVNDAEIYVFYFKVDKENRIKRMMQDQRSEKEIYERLREDKEQFKVVRSDFVIDANGEVKQTYDNVIEIIEGYVYE